MKKQPYGEGWRFVLLLSALLAVLVVLNACTNRLDERQLVFAQKCADTNGKIDVTPSGFVICKYDGGAE